MAGGVLLDLDEISCHIFESFSDLCGDMMKIHAMEMLDSNDAALVAQSLVGDREAFGQIVARYQSLICALAFTTTGSLAQSEDLAQETFVTAWKELSRLREPVKLRSWLCGIVRNLSYTAIHNEGREPSHAAEPLQALEQAPTGEPLPSESAMTRDEEAILWRSVGGARRLFSEVPLISRNLLLLNANLLQSANRDQRLFKAVLHSFHERRNGYQTRNAENNPKHRQNGTELVSPDLFESRG
jgi:RNA polymerase sigma factor (sigma-70 family)